MTNSIAKKVTRFALLVIAMVAAILIMSTTASAMTNDQKAAENEILSGIANYEEKIEIEDYDLTVDEIKEVQQDIYYQHPEAFFLNKFKFAVSNDGTVVYTKPVYTKSKATAEKEAKKLVKAAKSCKVKGSQAKKIKQIHDWLIKKVVYKKGRVNSHNAYGSLVEKKAVCQGYALAFMMIAKDNGLQCKMVMNGQGTHAWNVVKVGKRWYNVDVTWDDMGKKASKKYLLVSDAKLKKLDKKNHSGRLLGAPKCTKNFKW